MEAVEYQSRVEALAEDILTDKQLSIDYDRKRQENRTALRRLREQAEQAKGSRARTSTLNMGDFFIDLPVEKANQIVGESQAEMESAISDLQQRLKKKVELLADLEGNEHSAQVARSMNLKSVTAQELYNISASSSS